MAKANDENIADSLNLFERALTTLVGASATVAGAYAVFASDNQAGTAVLIVVGAVLTVIGVQGTPLVRFTNTSASFELARRQRKVEREVAQAQEQGDVGKAAGIALGAAIAEPRLMRPEMRELIYEQQVRLAILKGGYHLSARGFPYGYDLEVSDEHSHVIGVELRAYTRDVPAQVVRHLATRYLEANVPILLVTSTPLTKGAQSELANAANLEHVMWRDERDDQQLRSKLEAMFISAAGAQVG
jgi:hypothetical protein